METAPANLNPLIHHLSASVCEQANASDSAQVEVIANFAWQHMKAATLFRDRTAELESIHANSGYGAHFEEIRAYASACIMSSAASLEGLINELYIAKNCPLRSKLANFEEKFWGRGGVEGKPILEKYQYALSMLGLAPLDESTSSFQETYALIELRNALVHYKPTWDPDRPRKKSLKETLHGKYMISPFLSERDDFVTMQSMSHGCCDWAVRTSLQFIRLFDDRTHLDDNKLAGFWKLETSAN